MREEAEEHKCNITHPMKFFFGHLNTIHSTTRTSVEWTEKADDYAEHITRVKTKKRKWAQKFFNCNDEQKMDVEVVNLMREDSLTWLIDVYKLLQYICIEIAFRDTRHVRSRGKLLIGNLKLKLTESEKALDKYQPSIYNYTTVGENLKRCLGSVTDFAHTLST